MLKNTLLACLIVAATSSVSLAQDFTKGYYRITNMNLERQGASLEGNNGAQDATLKGAAFMTKTGNYSGQMWKFISAGNGYFYMTTMWVENQGLVLEGNQQTSGAYLNGAPFMAKRGNFTGQLWRLIPAGNGYYRLTTMLVENQGMNLEGALLNPTSLNDTPRMQKAGNFSGQLWKITPIN